MELLLLKYGYALLFAGVLVEGEAVLLVAARPGPPRRLRLARGRAWSRSPPTPWPTSPTSASPGAAAGAGSKRRYGAHPRFRRLLDLVDRRGSAAAPGQPLRLRPADRHPRGLRRPRHGRRRPSSPPISWPVSLWAVALTALGYTVGGAVEPLLARLQGYETSAALGLLVAVLVGASVVFGRPSPARASPGRAGSASATCIGSSPC